MRLRTLHERFLATPFVYDYIRPLAAGGIDFAAIARFCAVAPHERVFDLGCGTAPLLPHLRCAAYLGVDPDPVALARASRFASARVRFAHGHDWESELRRFRPDVMLLLGVVHHLSDEAFAGIVDRAGGIPRRIVTMDVSYYPDLPLNNLLSSLDRGTFVREPEAYARLYRGCGLSVDRRGFVHTRLGYVRYVGFHLSWEPAGPARSGQEGGVRAVPGDGAPDTVPPGRESRRGEA